MCSLKLCSNASGQLLYFLYARCYLLAAMKLSARNFKNKTAMKISNGNEIFCSVHFRWLNIFHSLFNRFNSTCFVIFKKQRIIKIAESDSDASTIPAEEACVADFWLKNMIFHVR